MQEKKFEQKTSLVKDVAKVASGTAIAQLVAIVISPILTRLYSAEAFGILGFYLSVIGIISVNSTLRYHLAILLPEDDKDAGSIVGLSFISTTVVSGVIGVAIFLMSDFLEDWFKVSLNPTIYLIIPIAIFLDASLLIFRHWHIRMRSYSTAAIGDASQSLSSSSAQLGFGFTGLVEGIHMVYSSIIGLLISFLVYLKTLPAKEILFSEHLFDIKRMKSQAILYKKFPLYSTIAGVINKLAWELPSFMLLGFFNPAVLGFYVLGHRLLRLPVSLIGSSIGEVYFERGAKAYKKGTLNEITELVQKRLVQAGFFPFFVLSFVGEDLFSTFFGIEWATAGLYSQILALWTFIWFMTSPNTTIYSITNNQDKMFKIQILLFVLRFIGLGIGGLLDSAVLAIALFAVAGILGYGILLTHLSSIAKVSPLLIIKEISSLWLPCIIFTIVIVPSLIYDISPWWVTGISVISVILYYPYIFWKEPELRIMLKRLV